jgi:hypothetical protein
MGELVKNIGVILLLVGAILMGGAYVGGVLTNGILAVGLFIVIAGYVLHIVVNKKGE